MDGIIPVEKGKHTFASPPKSLPKEQRDKIIKEQKRILKKEYNKKYYDKNIKKILEYHSDLYEKKLGIKVKCPLCDREVAQVRLQKHQSTALCKRFTKIKNNK